MREGKASSSVTLVEFEKIKLAIDFPYQVELTAIFCIYLLPSAPYEETDRRMIEQVVRYPKTQLNTPHIDLLWIHVWDPMTPIEVSMSCRSGQSHRRDGIG
jgi:aryl-alcohol dehydrogenase-like predicted oxidoreductase